QGNLPLLDQGILLGQKGDLSGKLHGLGRSLDAGALTLERGGQQFERTMRSTGQDVRKSWGPVAGPVAGTVLDGTGVAGRTAADLGASTMRSGADLAHSTADGVERVARRYDNPVGSLDGYLNGLSAAQRGQQVRTLLSQPINTAHPERYKGQLPTRADVIKDAARKHNLDPAVLSGFLLAEQRDQSAAEDEKDIAAATKAGANTSIGLGQVTVGTASKDNAALLQDTVDEATRRKLSHADVARLLQSDDHNIYAAARYLRGVANAGARTNPQNLPDTMRTWPGLDLKKLSGSRWGRNEVEAMGSEYTSKPWDDKLSDGWGWFVGEAVSDVRRNWQF
ncbi:MAG: hypothetical protein KC933_35935, partial [Myxococcales bacterium]|nr:hypothetical protein [Myxococcales bacterium]